MTRFIKVQMRIKNKALILLLLAALVSGCSAARPSTEQCKAVVKKAEAKRLYDEIERTDMRLFDGLANSDPQTADPRLLHGYMILDRHAREHNTTLSSMTPMERRQVLLDDAIKNEGASPAELTKEEREQLSQCKGV
jgi:hypothetical protein